MKELVEVIAKSLVDYPDEVVIQKQKKTMQSLWNSRLRPLTWVK